MVQINGLIFLKHDFQMCSVDLYLFSLRTSLADPIAFQSFYFYQQCLFCNSSSHKAMKKLRLE